MGRKATTQHYRSPNPKTFRLNAEDRLQILKVYREAKEKLSNRELAIRCKVSHETARRVISSYTFADQELVKAAMASRTPEMLDNWSAAAVSGARYGKHSPARDWLMHAGAIEPLQEQPTLQVAVINMGLPGITSAVLSSSTPGPGPALPALHGELCPDDDDD